MEHLLQIVSEACDLMPCQLDWCQLRCNGWAFWSIKHDDELDYQRTISPLMFDARVVSSSPMVKIRIKSIIAKMSSPDISLFQFWAPIKVNGSTFLSIADQLFALSNEVDERLFSYRRLCLDTLIPIDKYDKGLLGPPGRVFRRWLPEFNPDVPSYSAGEFPLLENAIRLGIKCYHAIPVFDIHDQQCLGVLEIVSTETSFLLTDLIMGLNLKSYGLYIICNPRDILMESSKVDAGVDQIEKGLDEILKIHSLPLAQIWIPYSQCDSLKVLFNASCSIYDSSNQTYHEFGCVSEVCLIESGKALVGRAFASQGSCFCKDVTLLSLKEYPIVPSARKAKLTHSFAICLQSNNIVCVVEYFLPPNEMVVRDIKTFLNMLLSTMKEQLPGVIVASGQELGQRMFVEVVKVSPNDEFDSFEIGETLSSVQLLQDGGETTESDSMCQQSTLQNGENNVSAALLVPSCSSPKCDSPNCDGAVKVDLLVPHTIEEVVTNRGTINMDVEHDDHIVIEKDRGEMMQPYSHSEQPSIEVDSTGNARSNDNPEHNDTSICLPVVEVEAVNEDSNFISEAVTNILNIDSHKKKKILRIGKDHGITCEILKQQFGKTLIDAAKDLSVSRSTLKRICREYDISRWPHHKTRKVYHNYSQGISLQGAEPYVGDQQCPNISQEKETNRNEHKRSRSTGKSCDDSVMSVKVTYRDDIIKFKLTPSSTMIELESEVEKRLNILLHRFSIKYQDKDGDWVTITVDSDLREGMHEIRLLGSTTMKLVVTPKPDR